MRELAIVIPAVKKNVAFPDDLVKKLAGISLIQRAINTAKQAFLGQQVHVVTDSEEIRLVCQRSEVACIYDKALRLDSDNLLGSLCLHLDFLLGDKQDILLLSPYAPLTKVDDLQRAYAQYLELGAELIIPVCATKMRLFEGGARPVARFMQEGFGRDIVSESHAFLILRSTMLRHGENYLIEPSVYRLSEATPEIRNYQDWWICEKRINRRRIVFRIVGNKEVGMGHIFRSLALAHEISDHEIRFVCDTESEVAASKLAGYDYWLGVYPQAEIENAIIGLQPSLIINDIIDTESGYIRRLKTCGARVVNFEDLGSGAAEADLTINELYDEAIIDGNNILWGKEWFFVRDEFTDARPREFQGSVKRLLIAFGGTDPSNYTLQVLQSVLSYCAKQGIDIDVITGEGYGHIRDLDALIAATAKPAIRYTHATGVMSHLMEQADIAICSNGRTVYELAHMNVPSIVLSHHEREKTHRYSCEENGFISLGLYRDEAATKKLLENLRHLVEDSRYRRKLFDNMKATDFSLNKHRVVSKILALLSNTEKRI